MKIKRRQKITEHMKHRRKIISEAVQNIEKVLVFFQQKDMQKIIVRNKRHEK